MKAVFLKAAQLELDAAVDYYAEYASDRVPEALIAMQTGIWPKFFTACPHWRGGNFQLRIVPEPYEGLSPRVRGKR